jgi:cardiolipin synthase
MVSKAVTAMSVSSPEPSAPPIPGPPSAPVPSGAGPAARWLPSAIEGYREMLAAVADAAVSIRFEFYIFKSGGPGDQFRDAFVAAAGRGVKVRVLLDGFGSGDLPASYWDGLRAAGGEAAVFNPGPLLRLPVRNHHKLLVVDGVVAFIGGFNIGPEYAGDGVTGGWRDLGLSLTGALVRPLASSFDVMWENRNFRRHREVRQLASRWRHRWRKPADLQVMAMGPALGRNAFQALLIRSVREAREISIIAAYFVPSLKLRRALRAVARRGCRVRLILPGKTDVAMVQAASRTFYANLMRAGIEIAEYQPQILHTKLAIIDGAVFVGSSNLDARSLSVNYELMVRITAPLLAAEGRDLFEADWARSRRIIPEAWRRQRTWADRVSGLVARFCLTKIDPWFARRRLRSLA